MTSETNSAIAFGDLGLPEPMLQVLSNIGYETPSPIQAQTIPLLLEGRDVLGQAQTGTGKTAAFALPVLARLDLSSKQTQVLVLAPTRELAIQVAEAFQTYAAYIPGFQVLPIYGGASYTGQLRQLKQGAQVVVGTPGRVMDHMRRGTLDLSNLKCLVLDEADEMLRMGFIDDVEWILEQTPPERQIALFSATMPREVRRIATAHLTDPAEITIAVKTTTASTIRQRYWPVSGMHKLDALTRMLEAEEFDGMIIFVRTKTATVELADKLRARGYNTAALNGDIVQSQRENTIAQIKSGAIDIVVATDVAARGIDVERISHVINYDIPTDTEAYVHRIGRTGRAGRSGDAILFVAPREKRLLFAIEKATRQSIELMELPSTALINEKRIEKFKQSITDTLEQGGLDLYRDLIAKYQHETGTDLETIAAALAALAQGGSELLLTEKETPVAQAFSDDRRPRRERSDFDEDRPRKRREERSPRELEAGMARFRIDVGFTHKVKPGNIVGAIANEANLDSKHIGHIAIYDHYSTVDLPENLSAAALDQLRRARVAGRPMNLSPAGDNPAADTGYQPRPRRHEGGGFRGDKGGFRSERNFDKGNYGEKRHFDKGGYGDKGSYGEKRSSFRDSSSRDSNSFRDNGNREVNGNSVNYVPPVEKKRSFRPKGAAAGLPPMRYPSDSNRRSYDNSFSQAPASGRPSRPKPFKK